MLMFKLNPLTGAWNMYDDGAVEPMFAISNPATNVAVLTNIVDNYSGVIITLSMSGNSQTIQAPTIVTPGRTFTVVNNDTSSHAINVNGISISAGEAQRFIFDGSAWIAVTAIDAEDITFTPTGTIAATNIQSAIAEVNTEKLAKASNLSDVATAATAFANIKQAATDSYAGVVELATDAETVTGTSDSVVTTPGNITARLAAPGEIGGTTPAAGNFTTVNTGQGDNELYAMDQDVQTTDNPEFAGVTIGGESVTVQSEVTPKALSQAVHMTAASSGSNGIQVANNDDINFGTGDFSLVWVGSLPDWTPSTDMVLAKKSDGTNGWTLQIDTTGVIQLILDSGATYSSTVAPSLVANAIYVIAASIVYDDDVSFYVNGDIVGSSVSVSAIDVDNTSASYINGSATTRTASTTQAAYLYNRALSADDVASLYANGVAWEDMGASQTNKVTNPDFESNTSDWANYLCQTFERNTTSPISGTGDLHWVGGASSWGGVYTNIGAIEAGKLYKISFEYRIVGTESPSFRLTASTSPIGVQLAGTASQNEVLNETSNSTYTYIFAPTESVATCHFAFTDDNSIGATEMYVDNISLTQIGCTLALEPENIQPSPGQWLDSSGNNHHAVMPAAGASLMRPKETFTIKHTCTWAGTSEDIYISGVNQNILPPNAYIESIVGIVSGTTIEDITIGDGSDTDHWVESTSSLSTGTTSFAIANHISDGTNEKIIVSPNANFTGSIEFTIKGYIL